MSTLGGVYEVYTHPYDVMIITGINIHERLCSTSQAGSPSLWCFYLVVTGGDGNGGPAHPGVVAVLEPSQAPLPPPTTTSLIPDVDLTLPVPSHSLSLSLF